MWVMPVVSEQRHQRTGEEERHNCYVLQVVDESAVRVVYHAYNFS